MLSSIQIGLKHLKQMVTDKTIIVTVLAAVLAYGIKSRPVQIDIRLYRQVRVVEIYSQTTMTSLKLAKTD